MDEKAAEQVENRVEQADELLEKIDAQLEEDDSEEACDRAAEQLLPFLLQNPLFAYGWLRMTQLTSMGSEKAPLNLDETELALRWACFVGNSWGEPYLNLGDFLLAERGDTAAAFDSFHTAADLALEQLEDAYIGLIETCSAAGDAEGLKTALEEARRHFPDSEKLQEALDDWQIER